MSVLAKEHPGDRTASVLSDDEVSNGNLGSVEVENAKHSWAVSDSALDDQDEEDNEIPKPSYTFDWSLKIRDFAFPQSDPRHYGKPYDPSLAGGSNGRSPGVREPSGSAVVMQEEAEDENYSSRYSGQATALYDFEAENATELSFREGQIMTILFRQCPGWLVAQIDLDGEGADDGEQSGSSGEENSAEDAVTESRNSAFLRTRKGLVPENYVHLWGAGSSI